MPEPVSHDELFAKLVEHDSKISTMTVDIHGINQKLDPIATAVTSMAFGFRSLLWIGAICAALVGVIELYDHLNELRSVISHELP